MSIDIVNLVQHAIPKRLITRNTQRRLILDVFGEDYRLAAMKLSVRGEYALRALIVLGLDYIEGGQTLDEFLDDFPTVTKNAAVEALELAKSLLVSHLG